VGTFGVVAPSTGFPSEASSITTVGRDGVCTERHGSETYFVLGETVGGRHRTLASELEAQTPAFRFSRLGPRGTQRQPTESPLRDSGNLPRDLEIEITGRRSPHPLGET
jgi:hypothetical protein